MNRKAVFMDIDGTLMQNKKISDRVINAIKYARSKGHMFFICTGRSKGYLPKMLLEADYIDGFVMACGMHCELHGETIFQKNVELETVKKAVRYFCDKRRACYFDGVAGRYGLNSTRPDFPSFDNYDEIVTEIDKDQISKMTIPGNYREEDGEFFSDSFNVYDMGGWSDVIMHGITKATGMQHILDRIGIPQSDSIGVGDGSNDLPMINYAGLGVAMGNAPENVKAEADVVTENCENDGVAVMIERYIVGDTV